MLCSRFSFRLSVRQVVSRVILRGSPLRYTTQCPIWAHIYNVAFVNTPKYGYASAVAMVLFVLVLAVTIVQFKGSSNND